MATRVPGSPDEPSGDTQTPTESARQGRFARMTTDEDVEMVQRTVNFLKPAAKFAGHVGLSVLSPTYAARKVVTEVVDTTTHFFDARRETKATQTAQQ